MEILKIYFNHQSSCSNFKLVTEWIIYVNDFFIVWRGEKKELKKKKRFDLNINCAVPG